MIWAVVLGPVAVSLHPQAGELADFSSQDVFDQHVSFLPFPHNKDSHDSLPDLRPSDKVIDPIRLVMQFCKQFWSSHTALTAFAKASVAEPTSRDVQEGHRNSLWPVRSQGSDGRHISVWVPAVGCGEGSWRRGAIVSCSVVCLEFSSIGFL